MQPKFQAFDYCAPPKEGLYWVAGSRPEYDVDADDHGRTVGLATGKVAPFIALAWIATDEDGQVCFDAVDSGNMGAVDDCDTVTHCALFQLPSKECMGAKVESLDYQNPPCDLRWVFGVRAAGAAAFSALVWISAAEDGAVGFDLVCGELGYVEDADIVTECSPFDLPAPPALEDGKCPIAS